MDFVLDLSEGLDILLTIICKTSRRATIFVGKFNYKARDWAKLVWNRLDIAGWGHLVAILFDWDLIFMDSKKKINIVVQIQQKLIVY